MNGSVYSVGRNDKGQLGYELQNNNALFVDGIKCNNKVTIIDIFDNNNINIKNIVCGSDFCFAFDNDIIYSWGSNELSQLGIGNNKYKYYFNPTKADVVNKLINKQKTKIEKLICGWSHSCILTENNRIYIWGNPFKEYNKKYKDIKEPININIDNIKQNYKIIEISSGFNHIAILTQSLKNNEIELYTFGANEFGQLGYQTDEIYIDKFNKVEIPKTELNENLEIQKVACGAYHTLILMGDNLIYGFGQNNCKQIGKYNEEFLNTPKKWNYIMDIDKDKYLYDIKCSNGISCLLFKNRTQIKEDIENNNNYYKNEFDKIQVNSFFTEEIPLKKII